MIRIFGRAILTDSGDRQLSNYLSSGAVWRTPAIPQTVNVRPQGTQTQTDTCIRHVNDNAVNTVFGNTILDDPVQEFVRCFISSKVDAIESALTFLHDNLHVDMPRVNDFVLVLSPAPVNEATQPITLAAIGSGNDNYEGLVGRVIAIYVKSRKSTSCLRSSQACGSSLSSWRSPSCCGSRADPSATDRSVCSPQ